MDESDPLDPLTQSEQIIPGLEQQSDPEKTAEAVEDLGNVAVDSDVVQASNPPVEFHEDTPDRLVDEFKESQNSVKFAEQDAESWQILYDTDPWIEKKFGSNGQRHLERAAEAKNKLEAAKNDRDQQLEKSKQFIDQMHEQANEFVNGYQKYIQLQERLAEATGCPVVFVRDIEAFIGKSGSFGELGDNAIEQNAAYIAVRDFFRPSSPAGTEFRGGYTRFAKPLPRLDLGMSVEVALKETEGEDDAKLLQITDSFSPEPRYPDPKRYPHVMVVLPTETSVRYVTMTPELVDIFKTKSLNILDFQTDLYESRYDYNAVMPSAGWVTSHAELVSRKDVLGQFEAEKLLHKAVIKYVIKESWRGGRIWKTEEIRAGTVDQLREAILAHSSENLTLQTVVIDGKNVVLEDFLSTQDAQPTSEAA